jgi:putative membrane protein
VPAAVIFNALTIFLHWDGAVTRSVESAPFHYSMHLLLFTSALLMWMPVVAPLPELRISLPGQMIYLFLQSVIPTIPGGWLTFADNPVYAVYDQPERLWGIGVITDQQAAGAFMKIVGGFYLWILISVLFFRWAKGQEALNARADRPAVVRDERYDSVSGSLTYESVAAEFERLGPAPVEPVPRRPGGDDASPN